MKENGEYSVLAYSAAIGGCAEAGEWEAAIQLFDEMNEFSVQPNVVTYSTAISSCAKGISMGAPKDCPYATAMKLFTQMKDDKSIDQNIIIETFPKTHFHLAHLSKTNTFLKSTSSVHREDAIL